MHRAENVDVEPRLQRLAEALDQAQRRYGCPIVCSLHPHTRQKMEQYCIGVHNGQVRLLTPLGFFAFVALERSAMAVLTDSGTVQEECCILRVPTVTMRDVTERPETIECGSNMLSGCEPRAILRCLEAVLDREPRWQPPAEYLETEVSLKVTKIVGGYCYAHQARPFPHRHLA
jgi:UDP-N-acetylglucosamine 2-epimerase (non-hydrolysing)